MKRTTIHCVLFLAAALTLDAQTTTLGYSNTALANGLVTLGSTGQIVSAVIRNDVRKPVHHVTVRQVDVSAKLLTESDLSPASYLKLAESIGMESPSVDEARLLEIVKGAGLRVYDLDKVDDYLLGKAAEQGPYVEWVWKPMRGRDLFKPEEMPIQNSGPRFSNVVYGQRVPAVAMVAAKAILERMPDARFFVSDYEARRPDPFLAVSTVGLLKTGKVFVIERWDEPGFGLDSVVVTQLRTLGH